MLAGESVGVVVVPTPPAESTGRYRAARLLRRTAAWGLPVLFARGSHPFRQIVAPARETSSGVAAARAAIEVAGRGNGAVTAVAVVPPAFLTGSDGRDAAVRALAMVREEASVLDVPVRRLLRQGNPVRLLTEALDGADLLVLGRTPGRVTIFTPGMVGHMLERSPVSMLVVPASAE